MEEALVFVWLVPCGDRMFLNFHNSHIRKYGLTQLRTYGVLSTREPPIKIHWLSKHSPSDLFNSIPILFFLSDWFPHFLRYLWFIHSKDWTKDKNPYQVDWRESKYSSKEPEIDFYFPSQYSSSSIFTFIILCFPNRSSKLPFNDHWHPGGVTIFEQSSRGWRQTP